MSIPEAEHREVVQPFPGVFSRVVEDGDDTKGWVRFGFFISKGAVKPADIYERTWPVSIMHEEIKIEGNLERDQIRVYIITSERREKDRKKIKNVYRLSYKRPISSESNPQPILRNSNAFANLNQTEAEFNLSEQWMKDTELVIGQPIPFSWRNINGEEKTSGPIEEIVITSGKAHSLWSFEEKVPDAPATYAYREYMRRRRKGEAKGAQA